MHTLKMYLAYPLTVACLPNFSSLIAFTCMVHQNFPPPNISCVQYLQWLPYIAHFEAKQWKPVAPPFKFPSEEEEPMEDPYNAGYSQFDDYEDESFYDNPVHTEEHTSPPHTRPRCTEL